MSSWIKHHFLSSIHENKNVIAILRHAHRPENIQGTFGNDLMLTLEGKNAAENLGSSLVGIPLGEIHSSPIPRCIQTAEELLKGAAQKIRVFPSFMLGDPGPFVDNPDEAGSIFLKMSLPEIAKNIAEGGIEMPGIRSLAEGGKLFFDYILKIKQFPCLMITHDIVICLLCCFFFGSTDVQKYFPPFLEGFALHIDSKKITVFYHHETANHFLR